MLVGFGSCIPLNGNGSGRLRFMVARSSIKTEANAVCLAVCAVGAGTVLLAAAISAALAAAMLPLLRLPDIVLPLVEAVVLLVLGPLNAAPGPRMLYAC